MEKERFRCTEIFSHFPCYSLVFPSSSPWLRYIVVMILVFSFILNSFFLHCISICGTVVIPSLFSGLFSWKEIYSDEFPVEVFIFSRQLLWSVPRVCGLFCWTSTNDISKIMNLRRYANSLRSGYERISCFRQDFWVTRKSTVIQGLCVYFLLILGFLSHLLSSCYLLFIERALSSSFLFLQFFFPPIICALFVHHPPLSSLYICIWLKDGWYSVLTCNQNLKYTLLI
jgi:hypothetical protein